MVCNSTNRSAGGGKHISLFFTVFPFLMFSPFFTISNSKTIENTGKT